MRSAIAISVLLSGALAFDPKICKGAGGCVQTNYNPPDPFRCDDGTLLNLQQTASNMLDASQGSYEIVSKSQFPTSCLNGAQPADGDFLQVHTTEFNQKMYLFLKETCGDHPTTQDCYDFNPNPSTITMCQLIDTKGQKCKMNPRAGECERWGDSAGRSQCIGWTPAKPEPPTTS